MGIKLTSISLLGLFGGGNLGNEGSLLAMLFSLRKTFPDTAISSICGNPAGVTKKYSIPAVSIYPETRRRTLLTRNRILKFLQFFVLRLPIEVQIWIKTFRQLRTVELIIIPGTGILDDYRLEPFDFPYCLLRWCLAAWLMGIEVMFVSIGAGPINQPLSRLFMTLAARTAAYRSYRDNISRNYMKRIGINVANDPIYPDLVFSLPRSRSTLPKIFKKVNKPLTIGVGVMAYYGWHFNETKSETVYKTYIGKLTVFVCWLITHGYNVRLIIGEDSDQKAVNDLHKNIQTRMKKHTNYYISHEPTRTIYDLIRQVSKMDIVIASRFHNIVCALMLNKPVLSLGYAEKNDALMIEMGLAKYCQHIEQFDVCLLVKQFQEVKKNSYKFKQRINKKNLEYQSKLGKQYDHIFAKFKFCKRCV